MWNDTVWTLLLYYYYIICFILYINVNDYAGARWWMCSNNGQLIGA